MKLLDIYRSLLRAAGLSVTSDDYVSAQLGEKMYPTMVEGKRLVLPTMAQMSQPDPEKVRVFFHPLREHVMRGESEVIAKFRQCLTIRLNMVFATLGQSMLVIAADATNHRKLNPEQSEMLSVIKNVDETTVTNFAKVIHALNFNTKNKTFITLYLKRSGVVRGKTYSRAGIVGFPFYDELLKSTDNTIFGVQVRVKDMAAFKQMVEYVLPKITEVEGYNQGTNVDTAPYMDVLMKTVLGISSTFNDILERFGENIEAGTELMMDSEWVESFENLDALRPQIMAIPAQAGNEGTVVPAQASEVPVQTLQVPVAAPVAAATAVTWQAAVAAQNQAPYQQPHQQQMAPQAFHQASVQPPQRDVNGRRAVSFTEAARTVPGLQPQYNNGYGQVQNEANRRPGWANNAPNAYGQPNATYNTGGYGGGNFNGGRL